MTDNEIIKALECCGIKRYCRGCYFDTHETGDICVMEVVKNAFGLIRRQQTEIERLKDKILEDDRLLNDRVQESVNIVSNADQKYINALEKAFNDRTAELQTAKAEIERLHDEVSKARRKALLEASSKFAGHSDYHGDTILCKLICMAEGKEVGIAKPLDKSEIKSEAVKEFANRLIATFPDRNDPRCSNDDIYTLNIIDDLVEEMVGDME